LRINHNIDQEIPIKFAELITKVASVRLYHGNCISGIEHQLNAKSIDVVATSPPYNIGIKYNHYKDTIPRRDYLNFISEVGLRIKKVLSDDGSFLLILEVNHRIHGSHLT
jgi:DNA modification methylase